MFYARASTHESRWRDKFQKLCSCLRELLLPPGFCRCLVSCPFSHRFFFLLIRGGALFSWFPSVGADHFGNQPPSTYAVTEYVASYIGGNAGMPIVLRTVQFLSSFSPSSILASAYLAFFRPSRERRRYNSLWSSVFPVPSARRGITSCSRLSPNARRHFPPLRWWTSQPYGEICHRLVRSFAQKPT